MERRLESHGPCVVAWVPHIEGIAADRDELALAWLQPHLRTARCRPVLRVPSYARSWRERNDAVGAFARSAAVVTDRGRGAETRAVGPTFVPWAHEPDLIATALWRAVGHAFVVTEHPLLPLAAWAGAVGAVNVLTGDTTPDPRSPDQIKLLEHLAQSVYNGWTSPPGDDTARWLLPELVDTGLTWRDFVGLIMAMSPNRVDLAAMLKVAPQPWRDEARQLREHALTGRV